MEVFTVYYGYDDLIKIKLPSDISVECSTFPDALLNKGGKKDNNKL